MTQPRPRPLTPAHADLRDFPFMPICIDQLFGSEFHAQVSDSAWRAGMTLWLKSFHQLPAGSLPKDEVSLARLAEFGRDTRAWRKVRIEALRGWIECDDGRLYHRMVAEKALEAWIAKLSQRKSSAAGNASRYKRPFDPSSFDSSIEAAAALLATLNPNSRVLLKRPQKRGQTSVDTAMDPEQTGDPESPDGIASPPPNGSLDPLPAPSQGKQREGNRREENQESPASVSTKPFAREIDDDELF